MLQVLVGLYAAVLRPLVVQCPCGVKEGDVSVSARAEVNLLQLQSVACVQVLLGVPQNPSIQRLAWGEHKPSISLTNFGESVSSF